MSNSYPIKRTAVFTALLWTLLLALSLSWNVYHERQESTERAMLEAKALVNKDLSFRAWATRHGGVYVPANETTPANPYLKHSDRDVVTTSGQHLTLINPAYMMRQVFEGFSAQYGVNSRITSLRPVNPKNTPDEWERRALQAFETGAEQMAEVQDGANGKVLRYMRPVYFEQGCDACHGGMGYQVGQVRGGLSTVIDLAPNDALVEATIRSLIASHLAIWLVGVGAVWSVTRRFDFQAADMDRAEALKLINQHLLQEAETRHQVARAQEESAASFRAIMSTNADGFCVLDTEGRFLTVNDALCATLGCDRETLLQQNMAEIEVSDTPDQLAQRNAAIVAQGNRRFETRYRCTDGSIKDVEASVSYLPHEGGRFYAFLRDITERKKTDQALRVQRANLTALIDNTDDIIWSLDREFRLVIANAACREEWRVLLGHAPEPGSHVLPDVLTPEESALWRAWYQRALTGESFTVETRAKRGGEFVWMELRIGAIRAGDGDAEVVGVSVFGRDISQRKDDERRVHESNEHLSRSLADMHRRQKELKAINHMSDLVQTCQSVEEAYRVVELTLAELFGDCGGALAIQSNKKGFLETVARWGSPGSDTVFGLEDCWAIRQGQTHQVSAIGKALVCSHVHTLPTHGYLCLPLIAQGELMGGLYIEQPEDGGEGMADLTQTVADAVTLALANLNLRLALREQATHDPLTGLFNRRYLKETLPRELARATRNASPLCAVMMDIDHFKRFNDQHGHDAGDLVLKRLGALLRDNLRKSDIACRYGGEELAVILPDSSLADAAHRVEQIRIKVHELCLSLRDRSLGEVTLSVGIAQAPEHGDTMDALLKSADEALYEAKAAGRNQIICYGGKSEGLDQHD